MGAQRTTGGQSGIEIEAGGVRAGGRTRVLRRILVPAGVAVLAAASPAAALVGNGYTAWDWGTTSDLTGLKTGPTSDSTCFLSGVAGNLSLGYEKGFGGSQAVESTARVGEKPWPTGHYWLVAHGGAYTNHLNERAWAGNPVRAQATCFWTTTNVHEAIWTSGTQASPSWPVKVADLAPNRQCFLSRVDGVHGAWKSSTTFARVAKRTAVDATHPAPGWYIETNLESDPYSGSHTRVGGRCVDFPAGTVLSSGAVSGQSNVGITSGSAVKACALTGITGAFNQDSWTNGALIHPPSSVNGNWSMSVSGGKTGAFTCAQ